jgi:hypothetical protein
MIHCWNAANPLAITAPEAAKAIRNSTSFSCSSIFNPLFFVNNNFLEFFLFNDVNFLDHEQGK